MKQPHLVLTPTDFVALANQTLENAFGGLVYIRGELANFRISKNRWVYFDIKDELSKIECFGSIYCLPGPLSDGLMIQVAAQPRLHPQFGFSLVVQSITPSGEGSLKKAFDLLKEKLLKEGLFEDSRKRILPYPPKRIALITSIESAAYADFKKIIKNRWPIVKLVSYDVLVQGESAPPQIIEAINQANSEALPAEVLVLTRGGGSSEDLSAFNDERVVRAIAASRIPTLVAIGHEIDVCLSELAADKRASTPSNAAEMLVPDKNGELKSLKQSKAWLDKGLKALLNSYLDDLHQIRKNLNDKVLSLFDSTKQDIKSAKVLLSAFDIARVLQRGFTLVKAEKGYVKSVQDLKIGDQPNIQFFDGFSKVEVKSADKI